jgi:DNA topoisomerase IA
MEGLITYHRTDSTTLSDKALGESARVIRELFGASTTMRRAAIRRG